VTYYLTLAICAVPQIIDHAPFIAGCAAFCGGLFAAAFRANAPT
jgi:hypothetical protein